MYALPKGYILDPGQGKFAVHALWSENIASQSNHRMSETLCWRSRHKFANLNKTRNLVTKTRARLKATEIDLSDDSKCDIVEGVYGLVPGCSNFVNIA